MPNDSGMPYNPSLDVLRVLAVSLVIAVHAKFKSFDAGIFGVDLFFVLSGYLITSILMKEHAATGRIALGRFYVRRLRRLAPALLLMLAIYLVVVTALEGYEAGHFIDATVASLYLSDYWRAYLGSLTHLSHTWSLAVEEHYYLVWPIVLSAILKAPESNQRAILFGIYGLAFAMRIWSANHVAFDETYHAFHNRLTGLMLGSAAAILHIKTIRPSLVVACILLAVFTLWPGRFPWGDGATVSTGITLAEWCSLGAVIACVARPECLSFTRLAWLGKYTYGIYLWHYPIALAVHTLELSWTGSMLLVSSSSIALAMASYHTIERALKAPISYRTSVA